MMWPSERLKSGGHYIVAMRYLTDSAGYPIEPSSAFLALRYYVHANVLHTVLCCIVYLILCM